MNTSVMKLDVHADIVAKLASFRERNMIPNIIFHGPSGCGKGTIVDEFVGDIYGGDGDRIKSFVMNVNCAHGKGIKFIREELKFFARINTNNVCFKTVVLRNADKLTTDAQSALRRCIESFSHTTRFFIVVEDKYKLLKPILSRFCDVFIPYPQLDGKQINLHRYRNEYHFENAGAERHAWLARTIAAYRKDHSVCTSSPVLLGVSLLPFLTVFTREWLATPSADPPLLKKTFLYSAFFASCWLRSHSCSST